MRPKDKMPQCKPVTPDRPTCDEITRIADLAWAAGFVDGEGCVHIARQQRPSRERPTFRPLLAVSQNHRPTLKRLQDILGAGGHISAISPRPQNRRRVWLLQYFGRHAIEALRLLRPYLVRKGRQAAVLDRLFVDGKSSHHFGTRGVPVKIQELREQLYLECRRLKGED